MQIGISVMEYMTLAAFVTGTFWVVSKVRRKEIAREGKKPIWVSYGADLFGVIGLMLLCRVAIADWQEVPSGSMEPTLRVGDRILVNKLAYGPRLPFTNTAIKFGEPQRGDVVVFRYPGDVSTLYVKRLVGLPGDFITYHEGTISINHQPFQIKADTSIKPRAEDAGQSFFDEVAGDPQHVIKLNTEQPGAMISPSAWLSEYRNACFVTSTQDWECTVPAGRYLMMGDNRDHSADSRVWGFLDEKQVYGKAVKVLINFSDFSRSWLPL